MQIRKQHSDRRLWIPLTNNRPKKCRVNLPINTKNRVIRVMHRNKAKEMHLSSRELRENNRNNKKSRHTKTQRKDPQGLSLSATLVIRQLLGRRRTPKHSSRDSKMLRNGEEPTKEKNSSNPLQLTSPSRNWRKLNTRPCTIRLLRERALKRNTMTTTNNTSTKSMTCNLISRSRLVMREPILRT